MSRRSHRRRTIQPTQATHLSRAAQPTKPSSTTQAATQTAHPFDQLLHQAITFLFHFLVITVPFFFTWFNEELFEFNKMILTYAITAVIAGCWVARMVVTKQVLFRRTWFDLPIGLFLLSQLLSTIFSIHPYTSWFGYYTRFHGGLLSTITYVVLFYAFASNIHKKQLAAFCASILIAALGATLYAIPEHFGTSPSCILIEGKATTSCWSESTNPRYRIFGTFGQPNWLAAYAVTLLPLAVSFILIHLTKSARSTARAWVSLGFVTAITLLLSILFTKSRSGFLGASLAGAGYALGLGWWLLQHRTQVWDKYLPYRPFASIVGGLALTLIALLALFGTPFTPSLAELVRSQSPELAAPLEVEPSPQPVVANRLEVGGTDSGEIRKIVWEGAWNIWKRYPLLGSGVETFAYSYYLDRPMAHNTVSEWDFLYNKAHNEFLNFLSTTGILGLGSYLTLLASFIFMPLLKSRPTATDSPSQANSFWLSLAVAAGLVGLSVSNFFGFSTVMVSILMFLLPAATYVMATETTPTVSSPASSTLSFGQLMAIAGAFIVTLWMLFTVNNWWRADNLFALGKQLTQAGQLGEGGALLKEAAQLSPNEALFHDELALTYSQVAVGLTQQQNATQAALFKKATELASDTALQLNPVHLNFYKSRARAFITLANVDESYLPKAQEALEAASQLGPTDAKVIYNLALLQLAQGQTEPGLASLEKAVSMKPNYEAARMSLAQQYVQQGRLNEAAQQYQFILASIAPGNTIAATELAAVEASLSAQPAR